MRVLLVKTSSLGDVIHTLPALTDAARAIPGIQFDWVVEEGFAEIPAWHPAVARVIPVAIRRWRKNLWQTLRNGEWRRFKQRLKEVDYDLVIDAQGLLKSAWLTRYVGKTPVAGLDRDSAREPLASRFYRRAYPVAWGQHAVERTRQLFAQALDYPLPESVGDYGLDREQLADADPGAPYLVFLHGTTWDTKHWPEATGANWPSACASAAGRCACPGAAPPSGSGPGAWRRGWKMPRYSPDYPWPAWPRCLPARAPAWRWIPASVTWRRRWTCRRCRCSARPILASPALRAFPGPPGQRLPLCAVPEEDLYLPADRRGSQTVRSQA